MKLVFFLIFFGGSIAGAIAQQNHFIYLQTDDKQPFYVSINQTVYSSSSSGYAIIPRLQKGAYKLQIGFPKNKWPEQIIEVPVDSDAGYALKNFGEKGWGLFHYQSLKVLMASNSDASTPATAQPNVEEDGFASTLAGIVNTPDLAQKQEETPKTPEPVKEIPGTVSAPVTTTEPEIPVPVNTHVETVQETVAASERETAVVPQQEALNPATILKLSEVADADGFAMRYRVANGLSQDTVQIFIPDRDENREAVSHTEPIKLPISEVPKTLPDTDSVVKIETKIPNPETRSEPKDARFLDIEMPVKEEVPAKETLTEAIGEKQNKETVTEKESIATEDKNEIKKAPLRTEEIPQSQPVVSLNSDCKKFATEDDFLKTRKRMAAEPDAESMIQSAKKRFKSACYTAEQIKNLSVLFLKDETRYNFFDAAYPYVSDAENFSKLETELRDEYYINRFKAMIR